MENIGYINGTYVENMWKICGKYMNNAWYINGKYMRYKWDVNGISYNHGRQWIIDGKCIEM